MFNRKIKEKLWQSNAKISELETLVKRTNEEYKLLLDRIVELENNVEMSVSVIEVLEKNVSDFKELSLLNENVYKTQLETIEQYQKTVIEYEKEVTKLRPYYNANKWQQVTTKEND